MHSVGRMLVSGAVQIRTARFNPVDLASRFRGPGERGLVHIGADLRSESSGASSSLEPGITVLKDWARAAAPRLIE